MVLQKRSLSALFLTTVWLSGLALTSAFLTPAASGAELPTPTAHLRSSPVAGGDDALAAPASRPADGRYRGHFIWGGERAEAIRFRVVKRGRYFRDFYSVIVVTCGTATSTDTIAFPRTRIRADGRFSRTFRPNEDSAITLKGRFRGNKLVRGSLRYRVSICYRDSEGMRARRVGP